MIWVSYVSDNLVRIRKIESFVMIKYCILFSFYILHYNSIEDLDVLQSKLVSQQNISFFHRVQTYMFLLVHISHLDLMIILTVVKFDVEHRTVVIPEALNTLATTWGQKSESCSYYIDLMITDTKAPKKIINC